VNDLAHVNEEKKMSIIAGIDFIAETLFDSNPSLAKLREGPAGCSWLPLNDCRED
jgi:hypothetical protein